MHTDGAKQIVIAENKIILLVFEEYLLDRFSFDVTIPTVTFLYHSTPKKEISTCRQPFIHRFSQYYQPSSSNVLQSILPPFPGEVF